MTYLTAVLARVDHATARDAQVAGVRHGQAADDNSSRNIVNEDLQEQTTFRTAQRKQNKKAFCQG
jgi:hypothetical protein